MRGLLTSATGGFETGVLLFVTVLFKQFPHDEDEGGTDDPDISNIADKPPVVVDEVNDVTLPDGWWAREPIPKVTRGAASYETQKNR